MSGERRCDHGIDQGPLDDYGYKEGPRYSAYCELCNPEPFGGPWLDPDGNSYSERRHTKPPPPPAPEPPR